eukprot:6490873-Amphidinium_carterae.1
MPHLRHGRYPHLRTEALLAPEPKLGSRPRCSPPNPHQPTLVVEAAYRDEVATADPSSLAAVSQWELALPLQPVSTPAQNAA